MNISGVEYLQLPLSAPVTPRILSTAIKTKMTLLGQDREVLIPLIILPDPIGSLSFLSTAYGPYLALISLDFITRQRNNRLATERIRTDH